jgi:hypothetical protein
MIQPSSSPFAAPIMLARKKTGDWRLCVDYRRLNAMTVKNKYPLPIIDELLDELHGSQWFTSLDLCSGYHQIRMEPVDVPKQHSRPTTDITSTELCRMVSLGVQPLFNL